ncbi:MAG: shikimate kinase [Candidatus Nitricoxidivorans perseverans]|uniref:Shikimate kinase n=1 Tax=Candidatus Nitricoxidivorans perseverans TaxID=2975601 RepID=A0AA49IVQ8_9PROT|nr:MAG: shikimate kinase [Candidatus Nitricoxidivorans perseverans]
MEPCRNIYLIGLMGAGKTTVGRQLAKRLNRRFVDADHEIESRTGVRIPVIFEIEGEAGFRRREAQVIEALSRERRLVLATGGGAVLDPANRACLRETGVVVYLHAVADTLFERTRRDRGRPLLRVDDPLAKLRELLDQRDPLYRETAHLVVESGGGASVLAERIEKEIRARCEP